MIPARKFSTVPTKAEIIREGLNVDRIPERSLKQNQKNYKSIAALWIATLKSSARDRFTKPLRGYCDRAV
jgi:hypothetical protein